MRIIPLLLFLFPVFLSSTTVDGLLAEPKLWELSPAQFFSTDAAKNRIDLTKPDNYLLSIAIFQATNEVRERKNLPAFSPNRSLHLAGLQHIEEMRQHNFFGHNNPYNQAAHTPFMRIKNHGGQFSAIAENLAILPSFDTQANRYRYRKNGKKYQFFELNGKEIYPHTYESFAKLVVTEWYNSRGHRKNLLSDDLSHIGIAVYIEPFHYKSHNIPDIYAIQDFGGY